MPKGNDKKQTPDRPIWLSNWVWLYAASDVLPAYCWRCGGRIGDGDAMGIQVVIDSVGGVQRMALKTMCRACHICLTPLGVEKKC